MAPRFLQRAAGDHRGDLTYMMRARLGPEESPPQGVPAGYLQCRLDADSLLSSLLPVGRRLYSKL